LLHAKTEAGADRHEVGLVFRSGWKNCRWDIKKVLGQLTIVRAFSTARQVPTAKAFVAAGVAGISVAAAGEFQSDPE